MHRLLVALLLVSGCAFGIDGPDPDRPRSQPPQCDTGKGAVALDGLVAGVAGLIAVSVAESEPGLALLPLGIGALYLGGAIKGNSNANKCRAAKHDYESYLAAREVLDDDRRARGPMHDATAPPPAMAPPSPVAPPRTPTAAPSSTAPSATPAMAATTPIAAPAASVSPPASVPSPPSAPPARAPARPQPQPEPEDDWSAFWREVP